MSISSLPIVEKRIEEKDNKTQGVKDYDFDNCYPQNIFDIIKASGTTTACTKLYAKFIFGKGFKDKDFFKAVINSDGTTVDFLLRQVSEWFAKIHGYAIHINYNAMLQKTEARFVPFEYCRLGIGENLGKIAVYDDWDCKKRKNLDKSLIEYIHIYTPDKDLLLAQIGDDITKFKGHIFWKSNTGRTYPLAPCDAVLEDVIADSSIKQFRLNSIRKGFNASTIVEYGYKFESQEEKDEEVETWGKFIGPESSDIIVIENANGNSDEKSIKVSKLDIPDRDKMYQVTTNTIISSIVRCYNQPKRLLNLDEQGGFNSVDVENDYRFYNSVTEGERIMLEEDFKVIFENWSTTINPSGDYSIVPSKFETEKSDLINRFGENVGDKIISIITGTLTDPQKVNILKMVYGLSVEEAQALVLGININL